MGFRDFITSRLFRRRITDEWERYQNIKPPANPSRRYIDDLVQRLLDAQTAWAARKELSLMGAPAVEALTTALNDPRFQTAESSDYRVPAPLQVILELLAPHAPEQVMSATALLLNSPDVKIRKTAAMQLAGLGRAASVPTLSKLLDDSDGSVRTYVRMGVDIALAEDRCEEGFRKGMYDAFLAQCGQRWPDCRNDSPRTVVALDPQRAAVDFASERWLSTKNPIAHDILEACNNARIRLPEHLIRELLNHSLPLVVGERRHLHEYMVAVALQALARCLGEEARPVLDEQIDSKQSLIQEAASKGLAIVAGLENPVGFVLERAEQVGFEGLTAPQRVVYCAYLFDAEVRNGGISQFFGNSSGRYAGETLEALRVLNHAEAYDALNSAIQLLGPKSKHPNRDKRLSAFDGRYDELQSRFDLLETAFYSAPPLTCRMLLYAVANSQHFHKSPN